MTAVRTRQALLGAHCSSAGRFTRALDRAAELKAECLQIFTRAPGMWGCRDFTVEEAETFQQRLAGTSYRHLLAHDIYLTNLASVDDTVRRRSIETLAGERQRCARLGVTGLVCHMGAHLGQGVEAGLARFAEGLGEVLHRTSQVTVPILLESSAGQGTCLGRRFEDIATVIRRLDDCPALGVCVDTCHVFAAGYDIRSEAGYRATWDAFERIIGWHRLKALHLNDSQQDLGCHVDRHHNIGQGYIGLSAFHRLLHDERLAGLPMVLETPDGDGDGHARDLKTLRRLRRSKTGPKPS